jgi:hypothetical protein
MDSLAKNMTIEHAKPMEEQFLFKIEWFQAGQETWARQVPQVEQPCTSAQSVDH